MRRRWFIAGLAAAAVVPRRARAALSFLPVQIEVPPGPTASTLSIANSGAPVTLQARPFAWSQPNGSTDTLTPTGALELSPPFFPLAHGDVQILRLVLPTASTAKGRYFRILLDELPQPGRSPGVSMVLRISLPVFMAPTDPAAAARLVWRIGADGTIEAHNTGDDWDEVTGLSLLLPGGTRRTPRLDASSPYLLPGAARRWLAGAPLRSGSSVRLSGSGRRGAFDLALNVGA